MADEAQVRAALETVIDPEIGLDIVSLGLVYGIEVQQATVEVRMTMTSMGCPMAGVILEGAEDVIRALPGVGDVAIVLVWEPAWTPKLISDQGQRALGA